MVTIREADEKDLSLWTALRHALWPDATIAELQQEAQEILASAEETCFLAFIEDRLIGFAEIALHIGSSGRYAHLEGWYVVPDHRGCGVGSELIEHIEPWCLHRAITRLTSDTTPDYPLSPAAHAHAGFRILTELTIFVKDLSDP